VGKHLVKDKYSKRLRSFGTHLKKLRKTKGFSLEELADYGSLSYNSLSRIENGLLNPTLATLIAIADALKVSMSDLCDF